MMDKYIIDIIFGVIAIIFIAYSYNKGFIKVIGDVLSWILAFIISILSYEYVFNFFKLTKSSYKTLVFCVVFIVCLVLLKVIFKNLSKTINNIKIIGGANKFFGGVVGLIKAGVIIFIISLLLYYCLHDYLGKYIDGSYVIKLIIKYIK